MTLQEHYNAINKGKGNKAQFLKQARYLFPEYFNQYTSYDNAVSTLKSKQIISEGNAGGVVSKGFDIYDWKKILEEEVKAEEKKVSKEVEDAQANAFDNKDMKNADNINFNEIMKGFYAEMKDPSNAKKTGDEIKAMVVKNLAKDPMHYTKNGEFGVKGLGYTDEAPALGKNTQPKSKKATVLGGHDEVNSDSKIVKDSANAVTKKNVQDTLSDSEANTSMPSKVKEMDVTPQNSPGVKKMPMPGVEKKIKLKEDKKKAELTEDIIKWERNPINEGTETLDHHLSVIDSNNMGEDEAQAYLENQELTPAQINTIMNYAFPPKADKDIPGLGMTEENTEEGMYQGRSIKPAASGGLGGRRFIPSTTVLSREAVEDVNKKGARRAGWLRPHIKVVKGSGEEVKLLISQMLLDAIVGAQRGRTQAGPSKGASIKGTGITSEETQGISGEFKKLVKTLSAGGKLSKTGDYYLLDVPTKYNEKRNQYEMPLPGDVAEMIAEEKIRSLIQEIIKEELNEDKYYSEHVKPFIEAVKQAGIDINADPESSEFTDLEDAAYNFIQSTDAEGLRPEKLVYDARLYAKRSNEEINENESSVKKGDILHHATSDTTLEVTDVGPKTITMKVTKVSDKTPKAIKVGQTSKTSPATIGKTYTKK